MTRPGLSARAARGPFIAVVGALLLSACGGGDTASQPLPDPVATPAPDPVGTAIIGLTDAPGDFLSYQVDVTGLTFERANGAIVSVLPESTTVDFAQYVETTELLTAASVPAAAYRSATLSLDYSSAQVLVEDDAGNAVTAVVQDATGAAVTQVDVTVVFNDSEQFVIRPGAPAHITLDFDLEASHKVELQATPPTATFDGVLAADTLFEHPKARRARGLLQSVDSAASSFTMTVRPFYHPRGNFGEVTLHTADTTTYEIDGTALVGADGLDALAQLPADTAILAMATFNTDAMRFEVNDLLAGSSVPWSESDIARGTVIARDGDTLTLRGATLVRKSMAVTFNDTLQVTVGPNTTLRQVGSTLVTLGVDDVSVGQAVTVHGDVQGDGSLTATEGLVRVRFSELAGSVVTLSPLAVELANLNGRRPATFDFTGTGLDAANDADPTAYEIDTGALSFETLAIDAPVRVRGLVRPFGTAPEDFVAKSVVGIGGVPGQIHIGWQPDAGSDALLAADNSAITLALSADALTPVRYFRRGGVFDNLLERGDTITLVAPDSGMGIYSLRSDGQQTVYASFANFSAALVAALDGTREFERLRSTAVELDATSYTARQIFIALD